MMKLYVSMWRDAITETATWLDPPFPIEMAISKYESSTIIKTLDHIHNAH